MRLSLPLAAALAIGLSTAAHADGYGLKDRQVVVPFSWTGFYAGYNVGYGWGSNSAQFAGDNPAGPGAGNAFLNLPFNSFNPNGPVQRAQSLQSNGGFGGGQIGYNRQIGPALLAGIELDIQKSWIEGDASTSSAASLNSEQRLDWFTTARARFGYLVHERFLAFVSGGLAYGKTDVSSKIGLPVGSSATLTVAGGTDIACNAFVSPTVCLAGSSSTESFGWTAGGGFEWAFIPSMTLKFEYLHIDLQDQSIRMVTQSPATGTGFVTAKFDNAFDVIRGGMNFRF
jgi:outer membrane immunogenic protein